MAFTSSIDRLSVGNLLIDNQHKKLISYLDRLRDAMVRGREKAIIDGLLGELLAYAKDHFEREELLWASRKYAALEEHKRQHQEFLIKILDFSRRLRNGKAIGGLEVLVFLRHWFVEHVAKSDMAVAKATQIAATARQNRT